MSKNKILTTSLLVAVLLLSSQFQIIHSDEPATITYLDLPSGSIPLGIQYNKFNENVYVALYWTGQNAEIN